jgi:hypothetical protein
LSKQIKFFPGTAVKSTLPAQVAENIAASDWPPLFADAIKKSARFTTHGFARRGIIIDKI